MDRGDKLKLLQDIEAGTIKIDDLKPKKYKIFRLEFFTDDRQGIYLINGKQVQQDFFKQSLDFYQKTGLTYGIEAYVDGEDLSK